MALRDLLNTDRRRRVLHRLRTDGDGALGREPIIEADDGRPPTPPGPATAGDDVVAADRSATAAGLSPPVGHVEDDEDDDFLRPFTLTRGRTRAAGPAIDVAAVVCPAPGVSLDTLSAVERDIVTEATERISVAEISARLGLALGVVRVLVGDLREKGAVTTGETSATGDAELLRRLIDGVRTL